MKIITLINILGIILLFPRTAFSDSGIKYTESITFPNCEFKVSFPSKTISKKKYINGFEIIIIQSEYDRNTPFMRAECIPFDNKKTIISNFRSILENQARISGIQNPEITIEKNRIGVIGTFSGIKKAGGYDIKIYSKNILGNNSIISLLTSDALEFFPSTKHIYFLNSVEIK